MHAGTDQLAAQRAPRPLQGHAGDFTAFALANFVQPVIPWQAVLEPPSRAHPLGLCPPAISPALRRPALRLCILFFKKFCVEANSKWRDPVNVQVNEKTNGRPESRADV